VRWQVVVERPHDARIGASVLEELDFVPNWHDPTTHPARPARNLRRVGLKVSDQVKRTITKTPKPAKRRARANQRMTKAARKVARITPSNDVLLELAKKKRPPREWLDVDEAPPFFVAGWFNSPHRMC
jgi:hypothetical protein